MNLIGSLEHRLGTADVKEALKVIHPVHHEADGAWGELLLILYKLWFFLSPSTGLRTSSMGLGFFVVVFLEGQIGVPNPKG